MQEMTSTSKISNKNPKIIRVGSAQCVLIELFDNEDARRRYVWGELH